MLPPLNLLLLENEFIYSQLQLEEALLRADQDNWCLINLGSAPAVVMGISGKSEQLLNLSPLKKAAIPVIRRFSGGGTVIVDEETLFITFICNQQALPVALQPASIMQWTEGFYAPLFRNQFQLRENDYILGHRKFGGNAQYLRKERWLHHTSFLWDFDPEKMNLLKHPPKTPQYRAGRKHEDFLCKLKDHHSCKKSLVKKIKERISQFFEIRLVCLSATDSIKERPHRKATAWLLLDP